MKITRILAPTVSISRYAKGAINGPAVVDQCLRRHHGRHRYRCRHHRLWRSLPPRPLLPACLCSRSPRGIAELGPHLLGEDPTQLTKLNRRMDAALQGHPYVKIGARHRLLGHSRQGDRATGVRALGWSLWRGLRALSRDLARVPRRHGQPRRRDRAKGYRRFQLKVGGDPDVDIERIHAVAAKLQPGDKLVADANTGWLMHEARRVVCGVRDVDVYIEQPCRTYEECLTIRQHCDHPFVLDENVDSLDMLLRGHADRAMDVVNIKISKFGGLTKARQVATCALRREWR